MSNPPIPVPSKAAIRALRGLVFGTTCSLAILTEDRRRRINMAQTAISNGEKLKSAKGYHSGGAALAIAMEEEVAYLEQPPLTIAWNPKDRSARPANKQLLSWTVPKSEVGPKNRKKKKNLAAPEGTVVVDYVAPAIAESPKELDQNVVERRPKLPIRDDFVHSLASTRLSRAAVPIEGAVLRGDQPKPVPRSLEEASSRVAVLPNEATIDDLQAAVSGFESALEPISEVTESRQAVNDALLQLSKRAQAVARIDLAQKILQMSLRAGLVDQSNYNLYNPCTIIEFLLNGKKQASGDGHISQAQLEQAVGFYLPQFSNLEQGTNAARFMDIGKLLLERSLAARDRVLISCLVKGRLPLLFDAVPRLHSWLLERLQAARIHKLVVQSFLARYTASEATSIAPRFRLDVANMVVRSVAYSHGSKADEVLMTLCSQPGLLNTSWVAELLYLHWQRTQDFEGMQELFENHAKPSQKAKVDHPEAVFRVMVQICLEAGASAEADVYTKQLSDWNPSASTDIKLLGQFAKSQARKGDWDGVRTTFLRMRTQGGTVSQDSSRQFVPVFKEFLQTHTIGETEDFLKYYISEIKGPLCREMVPLLANEYGASKDLKAFVSWLQFCVDAGFVVDARFSNAILVNAGRHWNFSVTQLRALYRRLHAFNPDFADDVTRNIMAQAMTRASKRNQRLAKDFRPRMRETTEHELSLNIKRAIILGRPRQAVHVYKTAIFEQGMPHSANCLGLAVFASLKLHQGDTEEAMGLIASARDHGLETPLADTTILVDAVSRVAATSSRTTIYRSLQSTLQRFAEHGCPVTDHSLNVAARRVLAAGDPRNAIAFALLAADSAYKRPGYNRWNFSALAIAYGRLAEPNGLRDLISNAISNPDFDATMGYKALKSARSYLQRMVPDKRVNQSLWNVDQGIKAMKKDRVQRRDEKAELHSAVLGIMRQAALDTGCEIAEEHKPANLTGEDGKLPEWLDAATTMDLAFDEQSQELVDESELSQADVDNWAALGQISEGQTEPERLPGPHEGPADVVADVKHGSMDSWAAMERTCRVQVPSQRHRAAAVSSF